MGVRRSRWSGCCGSTSCSFLQSWFNLSDPAAEEALYDSVVMRSFSRCAEHKADHGLDMRRHGQPFEVGPWSPRKRPTSAFADLNNYTTIDIFARVKPLDFLGDSLDVLRAFPDGARRAAGFQLDRLQRGLEPLDWKPMTSIGPGVQEIRVREEGGAFRVIYLTRLPEAVDVIHCVQNEDAADAAAGTRLGPTATF